MEGGAMNEGVHRTHCCIYHGCKYGWALALKGETCPVTTGQVVQEYPCEQCSWAEDEWNEAVQLIEAGPQWFGASGTWKVVVDR
jgi:hypothetical protein